MPGHYVSSPYGPSRWVEDPASSTAAGASGHYVASPYGPTRWIPDQFSSQAPPPAARAVVSSPTSGQSTAGATGNNLPRPTAQPATAPAARASSSLGGGGSTINSSQLLGGAGMGEAARRVRAQETALAAGGSYAGAPKPGQQGYGGSAQQRHDLEQARKEGYGTPEKPFGAQVPGSIDVRTGNVDMRGGAAGGAPSWPSGWPAIPTAAPQAAPQVTFNPIQTTATPENTAPQLTTNAATADPNTEKFLGRLDTRLSEQQANENAPVTASIQRATDLSRRDIYDAAAGQRQRKMEELAARGLSASAGVGAGQLRAVDEAARTRAARSTADISLARENQQDQLNLARTGMTNALYGQMGSASQVPFQQRLAGNQQALDTFRANDASQLGRAGMNLQAQTVNAQMQMQAQQLAAQQAAQQQAQQMAMWQALMGQRY